jgi:two-component system response regulator VicR
MRKNTGIAAHSYAINHGTVFLVRYLSRMHNFTKKTYMNPKILLVDDNEDLLKITQIILKGQGYETVLATSIEEAARKIKIHRPALILLDACLCGQDDGRAYCRQLKEEVSTSGIRIILMSGNEYDGSELANADDFLQKPFDFTELTDKVAKQLAAVQEPVM